MENPFHIFIIRIFIYLRCLLRTYVCGMQSFLPFSFSLFFSSVFLCFLTLLRLSAGTISSVIKCSEREYRGSTLEVLFPENYSTVPVVTCYPRTSNYYGRENRHRVDSADLFGLPFLLKFPPPFAVDRFYRFTKFTPRARSMLALNGS